MNKLILPLIFCLYLLSACAQTSSPDEKTDTSQEDTTSDNLTWDQQNWDQANWQ